MFTLRTLLAALVGLGSFSSAMAQDVGGCPHNTVSLLAPATVEASSFVECGSIEVDVAGVSGQQKFDSCPLVVRIFPARWTVSSDGQSGMVARVNGVEDETTVNYRCSTFSIIFTIWAECEPKSRYVSGRHRQYRLDSCESIGGPRTSLADD